MADEIIDLSSVIERRAGGPAPAGTMALWGADGERSRFALPLWRVVHLAGADRGVIFWRPTSGDSAARPFIVLDVSHDPARLEVPEAVSACEAHAPPQLLDLGRDGVVVCLGTKDERVWGLLADGGVERPPLPTEKREDILFLSGECAGLLFVRDFATEAGE
ncbi:MAG: hypothetical protein OEO79_04715 [Gemmatimonadota bacterium]|nr:hypothetical protein [Gemmatimonadota bacterium]MDH3422483.1 hypothetical protein [Gemmatimonadota bacterium]